MNIFKRISKFVSELYWAFKYTAQDDVWDIPQEEWDRHYNKKETK